MVNSMRPTEGGGFFRRTKLKKLYSDSFGNEKSFKRKSVFGGFGAIVFHERFFNRKKYF